MRPPESDKALRYLSVEDGRIVFQALAELPFKTVYELIGKMNRVTNESPPFVREGAVCYAYAFEAEELALIRTALGRLPYAEVVRTMDALDSEP